MEDLRPQEDINKESLSNTEQAYYYPTLKMKILELYVKYKKRAMKLVLISLISFFVLKYPTEIGTFIGDWSFNFYTSLTKNFK